MNRSIEMVSMKYLIHQSPNVMYNPVGFLKPYEELDVHLMTEPLLFQKYRRQHYSGGIKLINSDTTINSTVCKTSMSRQFSCLYDNI